MKIKFLIIFSFYFTSSVFGQNIGNDNRTFRVLSWNIYMLPRFIKNTGKLPRSKKIGELLVKESYDLLVFQEAFHGGARRRILKAVKEIYPYQIGPANRKKLSLKTNSGVWILSKTPITEIGKIKFTECYGFADCQARKGALLVETEWNGKLIQVLGTHIQAAGDKELKLRQIKELSEKLVFPNQKKGVPQLLCGDFNLTNLDTIATKRMLENCRAEDCCLIGDINYTKDIGGNNDMEPKNKTRKILDYILLRPNGKEIENIYRKIRIFEASWNKKHRDLSDHYAVEVSLTF
jgi:endonuclease/exonuclease/phosphatase family metal-dependent hydrolase